MIVYDFCQEYAIIYNNLLLDLSIWDVCVGLRLRLVSLERILTPLALRSLSGEIDHLFTGESDDDLLSLPGGEISKQHSMKPGCCIKIKKLCMAASDLESGILLVATNGNLLNFSLLEMRVVDTYRPNCSLQGLS